MPKKMLQQVQKNLQVILDESPFGNSDILAVYLFGSSVTGEHGPGSDIDLAFLVSAEAYRDDPVVAVSPCHLAAARLGMRLGKETDVTIMNGASLEMAYEVIVTGRCLFEKDPEKRFEYESALRGMYFDFRPFIEKLREDCLERL
ncbi:MAG: nucleotidyltransferase domain-containing protein [Deltaproteobacteria bacterium]|nr:nucleotidyltransferase domain-containing protein [Deltaproteobacteria bacterium]MBW1819204.1 nucleotidyltransferase domain-containing protein [Deltaproteobacteria bacterium]